MVRQRLPENERREQILQAASRVGAQQGLMNLSLRKVAEEAGVSHGLVAHHFQSKEGMQRALLRWVTTALLSPPESVDVEISGSDRLLSLVRRQIEHVRDKSDLVGLLLEFRVLTRAQPELREEVRRDMSSIYDVYEPLATELVAQDPAKFASTNGASIARTIAYTLIGYEISLLIDPNSAKEAEVIDTLASLLGD